MTPNAPGRGGRSLLIEPWRGRDRLLFAALAAALVASLAFTVHAWHDAVNDASIYVLTARNLAAGEGYSLLGEPFLVRPPGFSALLAPFVALRGIDFRALNLFVSSFAALGAFLLALYARPRVGTVLAIALAVLVWLNPGYQRLANRVLSDAPGAALIVGCLLVDRWAVRGGAKREVVLALCVAASAYVRTAAILLVPAIFLARLLHKHSSFAGEDWKRFARARLAPVVVLPLLCLLPWQLHVARNLSDEPSDQTWLHSYDTAMWHEDPGDPASRRLAAGEVLARVPERLGDVAHVLGSRLTSVLVDRPKERPVGPVHVVVTALLLAGWLTGLVRHRGTGELFLGFALATLLVYFAFDDRLALPLWMLALVSTAELVAFLLRRFVCDRSAKAWTLALLAAAASVDFAWRDGWDEIEARHEHRRAVSAALRPALAPAERLAASTGWHLALWLDRPVWSLAFATRRAGSTTGAEAAIARHGIDRVVLLDDRPGDRPLVEYFEQRHGPGERVEGARLYRVADAPGR